MLKQYLRELPENLLTKELTPRFEDACGKSTEAEKVQECQRLLKELPECNHLLISWLIVHMDHVIAKELETKMNIQNISIVLSPTVQVRAPRSQRQSRTSALEGLLCRNSLAGGNGVWSGTAELSYSFSLHLRNLKCWEGGTKAFLSVSWHAVGLILGLLGEPYKG